MSRLPLRSQTGIVVGEAILEPAIFEAQVNVPVMHQVVVAQMAARRAGTRDTKTRGEVRGSTRKIRKQKGTGSSRQGSIRAPQHRHGGIVHGPRSRSYAKDLPKRMRRLAIRSVLSSKAADGSLRVVQELSIASPSTKEVARIVSALGFERSVLVVTGEPDLNVKASARNLEKVSLLPAAYLNVADMLASQGLIMTVDAVRGAEALWGGERAKKSRTPAEEG